MIRTRMRCCEHILERPGFWLSFAEAVWSIHRVQEHCRQKRVRDKFERRGDCSPNTCLNRRNKPVRRSAIKSATLVDQLACTFCVTSERRREHNVTSGFEQRLMLLTWCITLDHRDMNYAEAW